MGFGGNSTPRMTVHIAIISSIKERIGIEEIWDYPHAYIELVLNTLILTCPPKVCDNKLQSIAKIWHIRRDPSSKIRRAYSLELL